MLTLVSPSARHAETNARDVEDVGTLPAEHEAARRAGPHQAVQPVLGRQGAGALDQPLVAAEVEERVDPVRVLADGGVHQREGHVVAVGAEPLLQCREVVLRAVPGVEQADRGHRSSRVWVDCQQ
jgi:hypothetical protein